MSKAPIEEASENLDIAVVGMAVRFPGAGNVEEFWRNLREGVESISRFSDDQLRQLGVPQEAINSPTFVKAAPVIDGIRSFDADFFGYSPNEASLLDPQHRVFLQCAWEAVEDAGYGAGTCDLTVGVYAGTSLSSYLLFNILGSPRCAQPEDAFQLMIGNDKDFLATRVCYKLNLKGPGIDVQTGCSTSLVAIHFACHGLLSYQCDMALAGGVSVHVPQRTGYYYQQGGISSSDGHCRAFDARGQGTVFGSGVGVVVLKRLSDAIADLDTIHAVIKGSAVNNDGDSKIGFTAPSVEGQARVITMAHAAAGIDPESISYVEAHGTATELGDTVEVSALAKAFSGVSSRDWKCAIGSVKTNIGHLDAAAGVAGFIKTVLALKHKQLPPSLYFEEPNPQIDFDRARIYVNSMLSPWNGPFPRRAGVSSFGIGGTNAHLIVEEAPDLAPSSESRRRHLLVLSARTDSALEQATATLARHLRGDPGINIADAAYTLLTGRRVFHHRRILVADSPDDAATALESLDPARVSTHFSDSENRAVCFMFPGGGAQYPGMGHDLYISEPVFREQVDLCSDALKPHLGGDLRRLLYPSKELYDEARLALRGTLWGLTALFTVEYSLARLLMSWGINPTALIGHSLGEYAAACISGVFSLRDALSLVVLRARLFETLPPGSMLGVPLPECQLRQLLTDHLWIAAVNGPAQSVVSGTTAAISKLVRKLDDDGVEYTRIQIEVAAHSDLVTPILGKFKEAVARLDRNEPEIPFVSNVTGAWIRPDEATSPDYWASHLRQTVKFSDGIQELLGQTPSVLLEVGPGQTLTTLAKLQASSEQAAMILSSIRHPLEQYPDDGFLLNSLGKMWLAGAAFDVNQYYRKERRRRIPLPPYPFEGTDHWIDPVEPSSELSLAASARPSDKNPDFSHWFYAPVWKQVVAPAIPNGSREAHERPWLVFLDHGYLGRDILARLRREGLTFISAAPGDRFQEVEPGAYTISLRSPADYFDLLGSLDALGQMPGKILHLTSITHDLERKSDPTMFDRLQQVGFYSLLHLAQAISSRGSSGQIQLWVITNKLFGIEQNSSVYPEKATMLGPLRVIPQEIENVHCHLIDIEVPEQGTRTESAVINQLLADVTNDTVDSVTVYRGNRRWTQSYEKVKIDYKPERKACLRNEGVYLITGGLGDVAFILARFLATEFNAKLALLGRTALPPRDGWDDWLASHETDAISRKIRRVISLEALGSEVLVLRGDVSEPAQVERALAGITERFGRLNGIIHAAGIAGEQAVKLLPDLDREDCETQFAAKAYGLYSLATALSGAELDFCLLISSNASVLGGLGATAYAAGNLFMDAFAGARDSIDGNHWISANWDGWIEGPESRISASYQTSMDRFAMLPEESAEAFRRVLSTTGLSNVVVSTGDLAARIELWTLKRNSKNDIRARENRTGSPRTLGTQYVPCDTEIERRIAAIWADLLGVSLIGMNDNFFDLGGNSLIGLKVISRVKQDLGVELPITALFEGPTVKLLATILGRGPDTEADYRESHKRGQRRHERRVKKAEAKPLSSCIPETERH